MVPAFALEVVSSDWLKDYAEAPLRYQRLGTSELIIFDPYFAERRDGARFQRYARSEEGVLTLADRADGDRIHSQTLGCFLRIIGAAHTQRLRLALAPNGHDLYPTAEEAERAAKEAALARIAELEEELSGR